MYHSSRESVDEYKLTCIEFIRDISRDYKDWVHRYDLDEGERAWRLEMIENVVKVTSAWIAAYGNTIRKIDLIKDDGINKMAEFTAGYPFEFQVYVDGQLRYAEHRPGMIVMDVRAKAREEGRRVGITMYNRRMNEVFQLLTATEVRDAVSIVSYDNSRMNSISAKVVLDAGRCRESDMLSMTVVVGEYDADGMELDRRGFTTLIRIV
ncbi:MAG: hypothetical protein NZ888_04975 [Candidatus Nitrosocaldus sp.]|nr:hypothetical protein [Candidatus Nitrosocaldus sp.]MDW8000361.1 hypothetical protein [Candidatus Nitrosocaldus sp.]